MSENLHGLCEVLPSLKTWLKFIPLISFENTLCKINFPFYPCVTMFTSLGLGQGGRHKAVK